MKQLKPQFRNILVHQMDCMMITDISEKDLKKYFRLLDSVGTIESQINRNKLIKFHIMQILILLKAHEEIR